MFPDRGQPQIILLIMFPDRDRTKPLDRSALMQPNPIFGIQPRKQNAKKVLAMPELSSRVHDIISLFLNPFGVQMFEHLISCVDQYATENEIKTEIRSFPTIIGWGKQIYRDLARKDYL